MTSTRKTRRAAQFADQQRDGHGKPASSRPQQNLNRLAEMRKRIFRWMQAGR